MFHQNRLFPVLPIVRNYKGGTYGLETSSFSIMWLKLYERERYLKGERSHNEIFRHLGILVRAVGRLGGGQTVIQGLLMMKFCSASYINRGGGLPPLIPQVLTALLISVTAGQI